ncbi:MAG: hypothetical protein AAGH38_09550 [Pseudomonadota bacterium]
MRILAVADALISPQFRAGCRLIRIDMAVTPEPGRICLLLVGLVARTLPAFAWKFA